MNVKAIIQKPLATAVMLSVVTLTATASELNTIDVQLKEQAQVIAELQARIEQLDPNPTDIKHSRDSVGDLNASAITAGSFPGSLLIPGERDVSLAIGGFLKALAYTDSNTNSDSPIHFPGMNVIGDNERRTNLSAALTRMFFDARANSELGDIRGYVEFDFSNNNNFNMRHAYTSLTNGRHAFLAGQYWSNTMDLRALPEGLTEPTISGGILARQSQLRYTYTASPNLIFSTSVEDASNHDIYNKESSGSTHSSMPDFTAGVTLLHDHGHIHLGGLARQLEYKVSEASKQSTLGWGFSVNGALRLGQQTSMTGGLVTGDGMGRYLVGTDMTSGGYIANDKLQTTKADAGFLNLQHHWNSRFRSNIMYGKTRITNTTLLDEDNRHLTGAIKSSDYAGVNLIWRLSNKLTTGIEYVQTSRTNLNGSNGKNDRVVMMMQLF